MNHFIKKGLFFAILVGLATLYGCGGGGDDVVIPATTKGTAKMVFSTTLPAGSTEQIGAVQLSFELPDGVTVSSGTNGVILPYGPGGVLYPSGEAMKFAPNALPFVFGKYTPATPTKKATVEIAITVIPTNTKGMNPGEFATLVCDLTTGATIDLTQFQRTSLLIGNVDGVKLYDSQYGITGPASASYTVTLQ